MKYLKRLIKDAAGRPLVIILDNHPSHHGKALKAWVGENSEKITLQYLPSYSPDLNPDEFLNCDLKYQIAKRPDPGAKAPSTSAQPAACFVGVISFNCVSR